MNNIGKLIYIYNNFFEKDYTKENLLQDASNFKNNNDFLKFKLFSELISAILSNSPENSDEEHLATIFLCSFFTFFSPNEFQFNVIKDYLEIIFNVDFEKIVKKINYNYDNEKAISNYFNFRLNCLLITLFSSENEEEFRKKAIFLDKIINEGNINQN